MNWWSIALRFLKGLVFALPGQLLKFFGKRKADVQSGADAQANAERAENDRAVEEAEARANASDTAPPGSGRERLRRGLRH